MAMRKAPMMATAMAAFCFAALTAGAAAQEQQPQMSKEQAAMMEAYAKAGTPGTPHQGLAGDAGTWNVTARFWGDPSAPPMESKGTAERKMVLGGRVLQEQFKGEVFGEAFEGLGHTGYDNLKQEFWSTWTDNMSTAMMTSTGRCHESGSPCTFIGSMQDPVSGQVRHTRGVIRHEGADKQVFESYEWGADGAERKTMEIVYTRKK